MKKRIVAIVLSIVFMFTMLPFNVFAEESELMNSLISTIEEQTGTDIEVVTGSDKEVSKPELSEAEGTSEETIPSEGPETVDSETVSEPAEEEKQEEIPEPKTQTDETPESESGTKGGEGDPAIPVESVSLDITEKEVIVGESFTITATVLPEDATDKTIIWTSSNEEIATVNNGTVTAVSEGNATITATSSEGTVSAYCNVTVIASEATYDIEWEIDDGVLTISGTGPMEDYASASDSPWYSRRSEITKVVIEEGVESIGDNAFVNFTNVTEIIIGHSVSTLGDFCFSGCLGLLSIAIPSSVNYIGIYAFSGCSSLQHIILSENLVSLSDYTFYNCINLRSIEIPSSVLSIGNQVFFGCSRLYYVFIPESVISISNNSFYGCNTGLVLYCEASDKPINWSDKWNYTNEGVPSQCVFFGVDKKCASYWLNVDKSDSIIIPDYITEILPYALSSSTISSIVIPNSVTKIGSHTFFGCTELTNIEIPDSVTSIGEYAFSGCTGLTNIVIPDSVTRIESMTFYQCSSLKSIILPSRLQSIGECAFGFTNLNNIYIPSSVMIIEASHNSYPLFLGITDLIIYCGGNTKPSGWGLYWNNYTYTGNINQFFGVDRDSYLFFSDLDKTQENVFVPDSVNSIIPRAFYKCAIKQITLNSSITTIRNEAFFGCTELTNIEIPDSVTSIGEYAFSGCTGLTNIEIPSSISTICIGVFSGCTGLTNIEIPASVTSIDMYAFSGCVGMTWINIPASVIELGGFSECTGLTNIEIPDSVTSIGEYAFSGCTGLTNIEIPSSVTTIKAYAFSGCTGLTNIEIPSSVTSIGNRAFKNCTALDNINLPSSISTISEGMFYGCTGLTHFEIPSSVVEIQIEAFNYCTGLRRVFIPLNTTTIGSQIYSNRTKQPFIGCSSRLVIFYEGSSTPSNWTRYWNYYNDSNILKVYMGTEEQVGKFWTNLDITQNHISIPNYIQSIPAYAFYCCENIKEIIIPTSVGTIEEYAFYGCTGLTDLVIPSSVTTIGTYAFSGCTGLTDIIIPSSINTISGGAFSGCTGLIDISIPNSIKSIGSYAFSGCTGLIDISIPNSITSIESYAFSGCTGLTVMDIPSGVTSIGIGAFYQCNNLRYVYIPSSVTTISTDTYNNIYPFTGCSNKLVVFCESSTAQSGWKTRWDDYYFLESGSGLIYNWKPVYYGIDRTVAHYWMDIDHTLEVITISEDMDFIPAFAFSEGVKSVVIPSSISSVGCLSFYDNELLESVTFPSGLSSIEPLAFKGCVSLSEVDLPLGITNIGEGAFYGCSNLKSIILPDGISRINQQTFSYCTGLKYVYIPATVTYISSDGPSWAPFYGCSSELSLLFETEKTPVYEWAYYDDNNALTIYNYVNREVAEYWAYLDTSQMDIEIPEYVNFIPQYAFKNCIELTSINIPSSISFIGRDAFKNCDSLITVTIPYGIKDLVLTAGIKDRVKNLVLTSDNCEVQTIASGEFSSYSYLESITLPDTVTRISNSAFMNCYELSSINGTENITYIGKLAFAGTKITHFDFGENVYFISGTAFTDNEEFDRQYPSYLYRNKDIDGDNVLDYRFFRSVTLEQHELSINKGTSVKLVAISVPETDDGDGLIWESSDDTVATVDEKGIVTGIKTGTVTITVTTADGGFSDECTVTVYVFVDSISITEESIQLPIRTSTSLSYIISPETATNKNVIWSSSDESIVIVDPNGRITGIKKGTAVITVTTEDWGYSDTCEVEVVILPESISLNKEKITIIENEEYQLIPTILPGDTNNKKVIWTTSNRYVATVDENGLVKGKDLGTAVITATTEDGGFTATCLVIVDIPLETIELNKSEITLVKGTEETLIVTVTPEDLLNPDVIWSSSDESIVTVDATGKVSAVGAGDTVITVTTENGGKTAQCQVSVIVYAESVELNKTSLTLEKGTEETLIAAVLPLDTTNKRVSWSSSNESVAIVDSYGKIYALKSGTTVITVTAEDGGFTAECNVTVIVSATSVSFNKVELTLVKGDSETLIAYIFPDDTTNKQLIWTSSDDSIATVDQTGKVIAVNTGQTVISVTTEDGGYTAQCLVTVEVNFEFVANGEKDTYISVIEDEINLSVDFPVFSDTKSITVCIKTVPHTEYFNPDGWETSVPCSWSDATGEGRIDIAFDKETYSDLGNVGSIQITTPYLIRMYSYQQGQEDEFEEFLEAFKSGTPITIIAEVKVNDGSKEYRYNTQTVTINYINVPIEEVQLDLEDITVVKGDSFKLSATVLPNSASNKIVTWSSSNESVAIVDETGNVTAIGEGGSIITVTTKDGGKTAQCIVTVIVHAESVEMNKNILTLEKNTEETLIAVVLPEDTTNKRVSWSSSDDTVALVDNTGRVFALKKGTAVITVTSEDGGFTAECHVTVVVSVESVSLNTTEITLIKGESDTLIPSILPEEATNKTVIWSSTNENVAIVDQTGKVTALAAGHAVIMATTEDGGFIAQCLVTVIVHAERIELNKSSVILEKGEEETLIATVLPEDTTDQDLLWTSSNESVAIVEENGKITAVGVGSAVITVTTEDGGLTAECTVSVKIAVTSVSLNKEEITLLKGTEETLIATVLPSDATNMNLSWSSSDETIVSVDVTGRLTAVKTGEAIITVTSDDGGYSAQCKVTVIVHAENVKLNKSSITLEKGSEETLIATVLPEDTTNKTLIWSSSNETVVTVDDIGKITAVGVGKAEITVMTEDGGFIDQCEIRVVISVRSIYLDKTKLTLIVGQDEKLIVTVLPDNATNKEVVWSDCDIADIDETGKITALSPGKQTITVTTVDGGYTAQCELTVIPVSVDNLWISKQPDKVHYYDGDVLDVTGGELTVLFNNGTSQTIPITSDMVDGFDPSKLDDWQYVTIQYVYSGIEYYCSYPILIESVYVMRIEIKTLPDKTEYMFLDELDITGGVVTVYYNNGISEDVDMVNCDVDGYDKWTVGKQEIHVYYHHQWDSFDVFVKLEKPSIKELSYDSQGNMVIVDFSSSPAAPDYIVYRRINKETSWAVIPYDATGGYYIFDHVSPGNTYYYAICCADSKGNPVSDLSEVKSITINPFKDVKENAYYYNALMWAYQNNVIAGTSSDTFSPNDNCTRGQLAVMIYRMFGKPSIAGKTIPFTDVKSSDYFYKAVVWAYNEGIITGTSSTKFSPNSSITRQDLVVMLWRMQNKPKVTASNPFTDVNEGMYSYKAIMWAYKVGVTSGTSATKFSPKDQCTRAQIAAFLYKYNKMFHVI